ncbi:putative anti-sigma-F factor NrsF [Pseudomonas sp. MM223]|nr:putative anti-sigma-F factor NrsF [Pseudomonas sp. MM223]
MKTDDLIALLAAGEGPVDRHALARRLLLALLGGGLGAVLLTVAMFGVRGDLAQVANTPLFWAKLALPGSLALLALWLTQRLARPGVKGGLLWALLGLPLLLVWLGALASLLGAPVDARADLLLGRTWRTCPLNITLLSVPTFIAVFWAMRGLAPTRLRQAGAAGGLLAGATATLAYCLHCPEMAVPFWGLWYVLGMLVPTAVGAALGPRFLRW